MRFTVYFCVLSIASLAGCASFPASRIHVQHSSVQIEQISTCSTEEGPVQFAPGEPLVILVHGCRSSAGRFAALADVYSTLGWQTLCFSYNDRNSIRRSALQLAQHLGALARHLQPSRIILVAHSQGGLVARHALSETLLTQTDYEGPELQLATVSSPFGGVQAAAHCGLLYLSILSLGSTSGICQLITGSDWHEINPFASFIHRLKPLDSRVTRHLAIYTDEEGTCRQQDREGNCRTDDYVFSLAEQRNTIVAQFAEEVTIHAGHSAIVGNENTRPLQLIRLLQQQAFMPDTLPQQALETLLQRVYQ